MDRRRLNGLIALAAFVVVVAVLAWFDMAANRRPAEAVAMAPAESAAKPSEPATAASEGAKAETDVAVVDPKGNEPTPPSPAVTPGVPVAPSFDVVRVEPTGEAVIAGQADPKATVEILDDAAPIATAEANDRGEWAIALEKPLEPGSHDLAVRTMSKDQTVATLSDQRVTVSVPEKGSKDVLVVLNSPSAPSKILAVPGGTPEAAPPIAVVEAPIAAEPKIAAEPPAPAEPKVALEMPIPTEPIVKVEPPIPAEELPKPPKPEVAVAAVEAETGGALYVAGTAATGETVRIYIDGTALGDARPSPSGTWLVESSRDLPAGKYTVRADQIDAAGKVIARSEVPFEREVEVAVLKPSGTAGAAADEGATLTSAMPAMETVIIKRGDNLWRIARGAWGKGVRWSTIYQANTEQIRDPHWIYPGQVFIMPKGSTTWTD